MKKKYQRGEKQKLILSELSLGKTPKEIATEWKISLPYTQMIQRKWTRTKRAMTVPREKVQNLQNDLEAIRTIVGLKTTSPSRKLAILQTFLGV